MSDSMLYPYLGWRARSALGVLSHPLLLLILTLVVLLQSRAALLSSIADAKTSFLATCRGAEDAAGVAASLPHFMAANAAEAVIGGTNDLVQGVGRGLDLAVQGLEALIIFVVDSYKSTYLCLAEFVVRGSLSLLIAAAEEAEKAVTAAVQDVRTGVQDAISGAESLLNSTISGLDKLPGVNIQLPSLDVPALAALDNFTLPVDLSDALSRLNSSLPTLDQLKGTLDQLIATPFEDLRNEIKSTIADRTINGTALAAAVPPKQTVAFCADVDTSFIDSVGDVLLSMLKALIIVVGLLIGAVVFCGILKERWLWKRRLAHVGVARDRWLQDSDLRPPHLLAFEAQASHPFLFSALKTTSPRIQWLLVYLSHPTSLLFFSLGLLSLVAVQIQLAALAAAESHALSRASSGVDQVTSLVGARLNDTMAPASLAFANSSNLVLGDFSNLVNNDLFGWADETTTNLNNTLNAFYDDLVSIVNATFGSTPLADPAQELVRCLIGSKVAGVQTALTFIHDNAHISLPTVSPSLLMLSGDRLDDLAASVSGTGNATSPGFAHSLVTRLVDGHRKSLESQRVGAIVMISLWAFVAILGVVGVLWDRRGSPPAFSLRRPPVPRKASVRVSSPLDFFDRRPSTPADSARYSHAKPRMTELVSPRNVRFTQ